MGDLEAPERDRRTVFVQGVSFDMQDTQFEEAFSEIGPIRKCFLLRRRGEKRHKGSGFVQFALPEDALRAVKEYDGKSLMGRAVQVVAANKRAPLADRKQMKKDEAEEGEEVHEDQPPAKRPKLGEVLVLGDKQKALRTIALGNLSAESLEQGLALAASAGKVEGVTRDVDSNLVEAAKLRQDGCTGVIVLVTFATVKAAVEAVPKLHKAAIQMGKSKKKGASSPGGQRLWARQLKGEGSMVKKWRVILRNLPFNVKENDLAALLSPAGFVWELTLPQKEDGTSKGFAFASFTTRAHCEKAIQLVNGKKLKGRLIAVDWAISKSTFETGQLDAATAAHTGVAEASSDSESPSDEDDDDQEGEEEQEQEQEVDTGAERRLMLDVAAQLTGMGDEKEGDEPPGGGTMKRAKEAKPATAALAPGADKDASKPAAAAQKASGQAGSKGVQAPHPAVGKTVFVRGLAGEVSKQQLQARLESFGPVRSCRLVMNPTTKLPKGTAFVEYNQPADAQKAAQASARGRSGEGPGVFLGGKSLDIDIALTQDDARALAAGKNGKAGGPKDKRNMYLAKEGAIEEGSAMWQEMSKGDQEKRSRASREKATKLRSPNFYISTTRLSLRNLPYTMDEKALKELVIAAVKERASKAVPHLKQVKVLRDPAKKDSKGNPQGKGIAFAEFSDHEHALCALRQLNNNPAPFGKDRRPIVEFAVENAQTMKKREQRETGRKVKRSQEQGQEGQPDSEVQPKAKRQRKEKADKPKPAAPVEPSDKPAAGRQGKQKAERVDKKGSAPAKQLAERKERVERKERAKNRPGPDSAAETHAKRPKQAEKQDALDGMIAKYRDSLFGSNKSKETQPSSSLKRWFE